MTSPYTVQADTWTATAALVSFGVACASTAIQGLIAHAFRQTIGDIIVTANSLGDVEHFTQTSVRGLSTDPEINTFSSDGRAFAFQSHDRYPLNAVMSSIMDTQQTHTGHHTTYNKRLDARGFFHSIPTNMNV